MNLPLREVPHNTLPWLLVVVPAVLAGEGFRPAAHTLLFVLAIAPPPALLGHATESVAAKTGDAAHDRPSPVVGPSELRRRSPRCGPRDPSSVARTSRVERWV